MNHPFRRVASLFIVALFRRPLRPGERNSFDPQQFSVGAFHAKDGFESRRHVAVLQTQGSPVPADAFTSDTSAALMHVKLENGYDIQSLVRRIHERELLLNPSMGF